MNALTIILTIISIPIGIFLLLLLLVYLFLPRYFLKYALDFDGSYKPDEDPIVKNQWDFAKSPLINQDSKMDLQFSKETSLWTIKIDNQIVITNIGAWIVIDGCRYSTNPFIWLGEKLEIVDVEEKVSDETDENTSEFISRVQWRHNALDIVLITEIIVNNSNRSVIFKMSTEKELHSLRTMEFGPINYVFPAFNNESSLRRTLSYDDTVFCPPRRNFDKTKGPVCFFNDARDSMLFSALQDFLVSPTIKKDLPTHQCIEFGLHSEIDTLPAGYSHESVLVFGSGIRNIHQKWADLLRGYHMLPKKPLNPDIPTTFLGYYTDNGAAYYYKTEKGMKADKTLIAVKFEAQKQGIPYRYYHLDSWWYQKTTSEKKQKWLGWLASIMGGALYGGALLWEPDPNFLQMPLKDLSEKLNASFTAHNRWFEPASPYCKNFNFIQEKDWVMPDDEKFWDHIMRYCKENNIIVYEQDWMSNQIKRFSHFRNNLKSAETWLTHMAKNAEKHGVTVQFCMETPSMVMQSIFYPAVTHARTSDDYHGYTYKTYDVPGFTQASLFAHVLGLRPFKDVFKTTKIPLLKYRGERLPELECLLASLSTGPVAPGDELKRMNKEIIMRSCRADGMLLQPTFPITAIDLMFIKNSNYYVCSAETELDLRGKILRWFYVLTINLFPKRVQDENYQGKEIGLSKNEYVEVDWHSKDIRLVNKDSIIHQNLKFEQYKYRIYAPMLSNGIAIIGNMDKFTTFNSVQFEILDATSTNLIVKVNGLDGETIPLLLGIKSEIEPKLVANGLVLTLNEIHTIEDVDIFYNENNAIGDGSLKTIEVIMKFSKDTDLILSFQF